MDIKSFILQQAEEGSLDFRRLEAIVMRSLMGTFREIMIELLEWLDKNLAGKCDRNRYKCKQRNSRKLETLAGPIMFKRRYYRDHEKNEWVHLLDEHLDLESSVRVSPGLCELAVTWAAKGTSFRDARDRLADIYGARVLSHEAIRRMVHDVAAGAERRDRNAALRDEAKDKRKVNALFIEADGLWARLQRPGLPKQARGRSCESKMVVIHEGWRVRQGKGSRRDYKLINPIYICSLSRGEDIWEEVRARAFLKYEDIDGIPVIINGDGAAWISRGADVFAKGMYQYDRFHFARDVRHALRYQPGSIKAVLEAWRDDDMDRCTALVSEALYKERNPRVADALASLHATLLEHREVLRDYRVRLKEAGFQVDDRWRSMGAAESNVDKYKNRIRKRGRAWSIPGLQAVLTSLGKLFEGTLPAYISRHLDAKEPWPLMGLKASASSVLTLKLPEEPPVRRGRLVAADSARGLGHLFRRMQRVDPQFQ